MTVLQLTRRPVTALLARRRARPPREPMTTSALLLAACVGVLLIAGLIMILSSSWVSAYQQYGSSFLFFGRQALWAAVGVTALLVMARVPYRHTRAIGLVLAAVSVAGLVLVLVPGFGTRVGGSSRWLDFGFARVQPSELAKLALLLVGAHVCTRPGARLRTLKDAMTPFGLIALAFGALVMAQPDLGTTLILGGITLTVFFLAGIRARVLLALGTIAVTGAGVLAMTEGYRRARLSVFTNPFADPLNAGYQAVQSQIALGSGGLFGVGLGAGRQKWLYVPNAHTDFIFSIIGEETGLIGTFAVMGLFVLLAYTGVRIARRAPDAYGRVVAGTITAWVAGQALINMGAVTGLLPITGVPLPLVSFGGSSLVFTMAALGILMNIARQERWPPSAQTTVPAPAAGAAPVPGRARARAPSARTRARVSATRRRPGR